MAKRGAPKKTLSGLPKGWEKEVLDLYREGASDVEIKGYLYEKLGTFSNNLWQRWMEEEEQFWETIKKGRMLSEVWWQKTGRRNLNNKDFSAPLWYMNMKNRFGWRDRQEITGDDGKAFKVEIEVVKGGEDE